MGDLSDFKSGQMVRACLAGASVTKTATLLDVSRPTASKMSACTSRGETTLVKRNSGQKSTLAERDGLTFRRFRRKITELLKYRDGTNEYS
jgi:hypothetical protein